MAQDEITALDMSIAMFSKAQADPEFDDLVFATSLRLPFVEHAKVLALSDYSGHSRNRVLVQLLKLGLDELLTNLPAEDREAISVLAADRREKLLDVGECD